MNSIVLCGFMGCGKSAVGHELSEQLGCPFIDMDTYIEQQDGRTISEIFAQSGEAYFRALEREACKQLSLRANSVIATGGGALISPENTAIFRNAHCPIVLIDTTLPVILQRLTGDTSRPLLQGENPEEKARALYDQRLPLYREAATYIVCGDDSPFMFARRIIKALSH